MTDHGQTLPTAVPMTGEQITAASRSKRLAAGYYPLRSTGIEKQISKEKADGSGNNLMLKVEISPLKDAGDTNSLFNRTLREYVVLPLQNTAVADHVAPEFGVWRTRTFLRAALGTDIIPEFPVRDDTGQWIFKGEHIPGDQVLAAKESVNTTVINKAAEYWNTEDAVNELVDCVFFGEIYYEEGSEYPSLRNLTPELPEGITLVEPGNFLV